MSYTKLAFLCLAIIAVSIIFLKPRKTPLVVPIVSVKEDPLRFSKQVPKRVSYARKTTRRVIASAGASASTRTSTRTSTSTNELSAVRARSKDSFTLEDLDSAFGEVPISSGNEAEVALEKLKMDLQEQKRAIMFKIDRLSRQRNSSIKLQRNYCTLDERKTGLSQNQDCRSLMIQEVKLNREIMKVASDATQIDEQILDVNEQLGIPRPETVYGFDNGIPLLNAPAEND